MIVTADHGRARRLRHSHGGGAPESSRVWLLAAGGALPVRRWSSPLGASCTSPTSRRRMRRLLGLADDLSAGAGVPLTEILSAGGTLVARRPR